LGRRRHRQRRLTAASDTSLTATLLVGEDEEGRRERLLSKERRERKIREKWEKKGLTTLKYLSRTDPRFMGQTGPNPISQAQRAPSVLLLYFIFCTPHNTAAPPFSAFIHFSSFSSLFFFVFIFSMHFILVTLYPTASLHYFGFAFLHFLSHCRAL